METELHKAIQNGQQFKVVQLLEKGAHVDAYASDCDSPIYTASISGRLEILLLLLDRGANINQVGGEYGTALSAAAYAGRLDIVLQLLERGADMTSDGGSFGAALTTAAAAGRKEIVLLLLSRGADINATAGIKSFYRLQQYTALAAAAQGDQIDTALLLLDKGADINTGGKYCAPALAIAAQNGHQDMILQLLKREADINAVGGEYGTALGAAINVNRSEILFLLLDKGANIDALGSEYGTPLAVAAYKGRHEMALMLLNRGANANAVGGKYGSVLGSASHCSQSFNETIPQLLLKKGADINLQGVGSFGTALIVAAAGRFPSHERMVSWLLDHGAHINGRTVGNDYGSALCAAAYHGNEGNIKLLLSRGADINAVGLGRYGTALAAASYGNQRKAVSLLLDRGADCNLVGSRECGNALTAAINGKDMQLVRLLVDRGADINLNAVGGSYGTALGIAIGASNLKMAQAMTAGRGAAMSISNCATGQYGSPLGIAVYHGDMEIVQFLLERGADVLHVGGSYKIRSGMYPNALDVAEAENSKASHSLHALLADAVGGQIFIMRQLPNSTWYGTYNELSARPPFPMPFIELHPSLYTRPPEKSSPLSGAAKVLSSTVFAAGEFLTPEQADVQCHDQYLNEEVLIGLLAALMGLQADTIQRLHGWLQNDVRYFIARKFDFGFAYAAVRVAWKYFNEEDVDDNVISVQRGKWHWHAKLLADTRAGTIHIQGESRQELIRSPYSILPRRIWDLKSNRVIEFQMLHAALQSMQTAHDSSKSQSPRFWAISHSWTSKMHGVETPINQYQWPVPLPEGITLESELLPELRDAGAEYIWLDVLCLRQRSNSSTDLDSLKQEEWKLDVPTIGNIYRAAERIVRYFNGLGLKFSNDEWDSPRHWLRRAWTLQEIQTEHTTINGGVPRGKGHVLMNTQGKISGKEITLRRALRPVLRLAAEVDSLGGCSVYELAREMSKRFSTQDVDKLSGLFYLLRTTDLPCYNATMSSEKFWTECFHLLPAGRKIEILFDYPYRGSKERWFPTWEQMMDWPERDPECEHVSTSAESFDMGAMQILADGSCRIPNVSSVSAVILESIPHSSEYAGTINETKFLGFYSPYLSQEQIMTKNAKNQSIEFTLCISRLGNPYNWLVCELVEKKVETQGEGGASSPGEIHVLKKVGVLRTDSLSELLVGGKHGTSMLRGINCLFV